MKKPSTTIITFNKWLAQNFLLKLLKKHIEELNKSNI